MKIYKLLFLIVIMLFSCKENQPIISKRADLLGFKTKILAELGEDLFDDLELKAEKGFIPKEYINDVLYISYLEILNACGNYEGTFETKNDTIFLKLNLTSEEVCTSLNARRVTYLIDNPDLKKLVVIKK